MSESITTAHPQYLRKDINGDSVLATFEGFLNQLQAKGQSGKILQIISNPAEQGLGGLGKTFEIWNLLTWFRDKNHLSDVLEVIDFSEDSDRFGILNQVVTNLEAQTSKAAFTTFNDFRDSIKKQESILQNSISKTAEETFYMDLAKNKKWKIKNNNPPILFFDSTDWIIDEEILKLRKTQTIVDNWESRLRESEIKQGSFFNWLIGEEGLFKRLVNSGIFIVLSGRYDLSIISSYKANNVIGEFISKTILLGGFNLDDLKSYIKNALHINEIPADILNDTRLQSILDISKNKPVMAVAIADFIANQYRKGRPETLNQKLWIRLDSVKPSQSYWELLEFFIDNLYDLTGSLESAEAVKLMNLVFYGLEPDKFAELMMPKGSEFWKAIEGLSLVKRYPNARTGRPLKYLRPHDDILVEFHKYWKEKNDPFKDFWYPRCLEEFGRSSVWKKLESEDTLLKNQELYYLTYLFEAATSDEDWEKATRYAQYVFSEHIDQNPDHAERILSRSEIYLPFIKEKFKDFSNAQLDYCFWISFRRVEYWLTERSTESEVKAKERLELMLDRLKGKNKNNQISVVYGYLGEYYIWNNLFEKAEDYLNLAISEAIHSGDETQLIPWLLHLKGFRYNRNADFEKALLFNLLAEQKSLPYLYEKAKKIFKEYSPELTFFEQDQREAFRFRRILRVLQRAVGNLSAISLYSGNTSVALKNSLGQLYLWESITNSDREKARVYANLLKAVGLKGWTSWGNWNQETGSKLITNFEKEPQVSRNLVIAEVMTNYWKRGLKPLNYFLSEDFEGIIEKNWSRYSKDDQLLEKGLSKIDAELSRTKFRNFENNEIYSVNPNQIIPKDWKSPSREHADLFYLKGEIHLSIWKKDTIDYSSVNTAFLNSLEAAQRSGFYYLEMKAVESLMTLSWLRNKVEQFAGYKDKFSEFDGKNYPEYPDLYLRYYCTLGNDLFQKALRYIKTDKITAGKFIEEATREYCTMLEYGLRHNQDSYDFSLEVISRRIRHLLSNEIYWNLIDQMENSFVSFLNPSSILIKETYLRSYLKDYLFSGVRIIISRLSTETIKNIIKKLEYGQRFFHQRGFSQKSIEINVLIKTYLQGKLKENPNDPVTTRKYILTLYRLSNIYQYINNNTAAYESLDEARKYLTETAREKNQFQLALAAVVEVGFSSLQYKAGEFSVIERFLSGEEVYFTRRHSELFSKVRPLFRTANKTLSLYCKHPLDDEEKIDFLRILSEGCLQMGELLMLSSISKGSPQESHNLQKNEDDRLIFQELSKLIQNSRERKRLELHIQTGSNPWLEYAHILAQEIHDINRQADALQSIYNFWYLQNKDYEEQPLPRTEGELNLLYSTVKAYCLNFATLGKLLQTGFSAGVENANLRIPVEQNPGSKLSLIRSLLAEIKQDFDFTKPPETRIALTDIYKNFDSDEKRFKMKELISKCVRYLPELQDRMFDRKDFASPFIYSKQKMVMGDRMFSKYFIPDEQVYDKIFEQTKAKKHQEELLLEHFGYKNLEDCQKPRPLEFGIDMRKMLEHYLEGLDVLYTQPFDTVEFNNYLIEIQRRMLLIPDHRAMEEMEKNFDVTWNQFPRLSKDQGLKDEVFTTLQGKYIGLSTKIIFRKIGKPT